ncbi:MAG TPA: TolC family protein [Vicinamibacterales bacterium]|nr:TolC family protein [Vicinamibacterales bacterium]
MRTRSWRVALALLSFSAPVAGQTVISEADALARLSTDSPRVRAIRASVDLARAEVLSAGRWPNPRASYNRESVSGVTENMVTVTQALPVSGRRGLEMSAASALAEARATRADEEIRRVRADLRLAYGDLVSAQVRETALSRSLDRLRELASVLARRESAGDAAGYDRLRADREVMDMEGEWSQARADRARAQAALAGFFADSRDSMSLVAAVPDVSTRPALAPLEDLLNRAEGVRGEPAALRHEVESAQFAERAASRRLVPDPEIVAGTKSSNFAGGDVGSVFSVHATVPLFDHAQPEHAVAQARLAQAAANAAAFQTALRAQITALRAVVLERREAADRYRAAATQGSDVLERIARVSYDAGERGILELLDAYRSGASARVRSAALDAAVRQAEIELEFVSGWEIQ